MFLPLDAPLPWTVTRPPSRCEVRHGRGGRERSHGGRSSVGDRRVVRHNFGDRRRWRVGPCSKQREESKSRRSRENRGGSRRHCGDCSVVCSIMSQLQGQTENKTIVEAGLCENRSSCLQIHEH